MAVDVSDSAEGADQTGGAEIDIPTAAPSPTMSPTPFREFVFGEFEDESAGPLLQNASTNVTDPFEPHWMRTGAILVDLETDQAWFRERKPVPPRIGAESEGLPSEGEPGSEY